MPDPSRPEEIDLSERVYDELKRLASRYMGQERPGHTLQPTALVHEAYLRLSNSGAEITDRTHFLALCARTMRRVLIDYARRHQAARRGSGGQRVTLDLEHENEGEKSANLSSFDLLELHRALEGLFETHPRKARVIELRYFGGMEVEEIADHLAVSRRTVLYDCRAARAWLQSELNAPDR